MRELSPDFLDLLQEFRREDVDYLIVGGYAVAFHGHPRYTADFDVWVARTEENARKVFQALARFGAPIAAEDAMALAVGQSALGFGTPPHQIHLLNFLTGADWHQAFGRADLFEIDGVPTRVIALVDLLQSKRSVGRPQDLADIDRLEKIHRSVPKTEDRAE